MKKIFVVTCVMLVVCLAMAPPTFGAVTAVQDGDWNDPATWGGVAPSGSIYITGGETVTVNATATGGAFTRVYNNSHLIINANLTLTDDLVIQSGSTVTMNAGMLELNPEKLKIGEGAGTGAFYMKGGTAHVNEDIELFAGGLLEFSGGSFTHDVPLEFEGGTIRVVGDGASLISLTNTDPGNGTYEFVPTAAGGITAITSGDTKTGLLNVNLDALSASATMTLFTGGWVDVFLVGDVTITQGATTLTAGTAGSLLLNEYALTYPGANSMDLEVNVIPEPATMSLLALGGLAMLRRRRRA